MPLDLCFFPVGPIQANTVIVADKEKKECVVIDAGDEGNTINKVCGSIWLLTNIEDSPIFIFFAEAWCQVPRLQGEGSYRHPWSSWCLLGFVIPFNNWLASWL